MPDTCIKIRACVTFPLWRPLSVTFVVVTAVLIYKEVLSEIQEG